MMELLNKLFLKPTDNGWLQLFRYAFVGGFSFVIDFCLLFFLKEYVELHYLVATSFAFLGGLLTNYMLSIIWVFQISSLRSRWMEFLIFALVGVVGLGLTNLFMWLLTDQLGVYYLLSKILTTLLVYLWNFGGRKFLLFSRGHSN